MISKRSDYELSDRRKSEKSFKRIPLKQFMLLYYELIYSSITVSMLMTVSQYSEELVINTHTHTHSLDL